MEGGAGGGGGGASWANPAFTPANVMFPTTTPPTGDGTVTFTWTPDPTCAVTPVFSGPANALTVSPRFTG
jgi:hypothetical protein